MTGTRTPPRPAPSVRRPIVAGIVVLAVLAVVFGLGIGSVTRESAFVDAVTIDNPTVYNLQVDVAAPGDGPALALGTVPREGGRSFEQVVDQGDLWVFRLTFGGEDAGRIEVPRPQLEQDGWKVAVPAGVGARLAAAGHPPSAL